MNLVFESAMFEFNIPFIILVFSLFIGAILYTIRHLEKIGVVHKIAISIFLFFIFLELYGHIMKVLASQRVQRIILSDSYKVLEGQIQDFKSMPKSGHELEHFKVQGHYFEILYTGNYPNDKSLYYTLTKNRNGPIRDNGQKVKIYYIVENRKNKIIKLWIENK